MDSKGITNKSEKPTLYKTTYRYRKEHITANTRGND